jgi:hypothetical protein
VKHQGAFNRTIDAIVGLLLTAAIIIVAITAAAVVLKGGQQLYDQYQLRMQQRGFDQ